MGARSEKYRIEIVGRKDAFHLALAFGRMGMEYILRSMEGSRFTEQKAVGFEELSRALVKAPKTWLPALLRRLVAVCVQQKVFKDDRSMIQFVEKSQQIGRDPTWMLRE